MNLNDTVSSDLQICADGITFHVHRDVLVPISVYVREFFQSPMTRRSPEATATVHISLPILTIAAELCTMEISPLAAFELFLCGCYKHLDFARLRLDELFAVAIIADFMICEEIISMVDCHTANIDFSFSSWVPALEFAKALGLRLTAQKLLQRQNIGLLQKLTKLDIFYKLEEGDIFAIIQGPNLPFLTKIFATFWYCTGLHDDEFSSKDNVQVVGDSKSASFVRFMKAIINQIENKVTLEFVINMAEKFELISDNGRPLSTSSLFKLIARRAISMIR